jgi:hypothetical protein
MTFTEHSPEIRGGSLELTGISSEVTHVLAYL